MSGSTLTVEQAQVLDLLVRSIRTPQAAAQPDLLQTWFGVSRAEAAQAVSGLLAKKDALEQRFLDWVERFPIDSAMEFLAGASLAFYAAEKETNPKVNTYIDAFYYIATCASVGYADVFAMTQQGRAVASLVMIVGPAMTNQLLQRSKAPAVSHPVTQA